MHAWGEVNPRARLFCFPYAGGSAPVFAGWGERLSPKIEVWAAQPRGRGMRFKDAPCLTVPEMVEDYLSVLRAELIANPELPFAFYGHSLGGVIAFELTRQLEAEGLPVPEHVFIGASAPPHLGLIHPRVLHLPDAEFVDAVQERYQGIPAAVLNEPELMELLLPVLKADFAAYENYEYPAAALVPCPLTVFAGQDDRGMRPELLQGWSRHASGPFAWYTVAGDHFFLATPESREFVLETIHGMILDKVQSRIQGSMQELATAGVVERA
jgi:surfactin synthase thioesterase subunit